MFDYSRDFTRPGRSTAIAENGLVATSHPLASMAALDVLREGGNAVDAAVAAVVVQGVVDPHMTGVGGDCFAMLAMAGGPIVTVNGSGPAPAAARLEHIGRPGMATVPETHPYAVTVPGAVHAWCRLVERYGRFDLERVLRSAIGFAENGYWVTPRVHFDWERYRGKLVHEPAARHFLPGGQVPAVGDRLDNPALGRTLRAIARRGPAAFYEGEVATDIVATLASLGGVMSEADLAAYRSFETDPVSARYRGHDLLECPPNGQGLAALIIARILDGFDMASLTEADRIHLLAEASKAAYVQRDALIADPRHLTFEVAELLSDAAIEPMRRRIDLGRAAPPGSWDVPEHPDTVYVCVVDRDRNAVSLISSIFAAFGSGIYAERSGVLLQNRGCGFSLTPGHPNALDGGKLPFHSIIPAMLAKDGRAVMPFGVMGGQFQSVGHTHILSQMLDLGLNPQAANEQPRSFAYGGKLKLETTIPRPVANDLAARGHDIEWATEPVGGSQAIWIDHDRGLLFGASDHRKDGYALGY